MKTRYEEYGTPHYFIISLMLIILITLMLSCNSANNTADKPSGKIIKHSECKKTLLDSSANSKDSIVYQFDGKSLLKLRHINGAFNCCPGDITSEISIEKNSILVTEHEKQAGCYCNCLYDIDFEIQNLLPGSYHIVIVEPYKLPEEPLLEFNMDLTNYPTGSFFVERWHYPWI